MVSLAVSLPRPIAFTRIYERGVEQSQFSICGNPHGLRIPIESVVTMMRGLKVSTRFHWTERLRRKYLLW